MSRTAFGSRVDTPNHITEALAKPDTEINEDYDFWNAARNLKAAYVKFCNAYRNRVRNTLAEFRA